MPTIEEVCSTFGLTDVNVEYSEADYQNLSNYKLFQQHVRPMLTKENPKVNKFLKLVVNKVYEYELKRQSQSIITINIIQIFFKLNMYLPYIRLDIKDHEKIYTFCISFYLTLNILMYVLI